MTVYLNSASHGQPSHRTLQRIQTYYALEQKIGVFEAAQQSQHELEQVREYAAALINAHPSSLGFSYTTTAAWLAIVARLNFSKGRILVAPHEWGDNLRLLTRLTKNTKATIEVLPSLDLDVPDLNTWQERIDDDVAMIFVVVKYLVVSKQ